MFKGLKSKLEDQGKKLQASVAQYGEQLTEQLGSMRSAASDAGSDAGSNITRRFLNVVGGGSSTTHPSLEDSLNHAVGSALMEEVAEADLLGLDIPKRERRWSGGSTHSNESSFSSFFQSVPGMAASTLDDIESDKESTLDEHGSAVVRSASKEQITSVLSKLQGRAANYKDKYRELVKKYNEVVTENNKCRTILAQTQDKALERIEKLRNEKKSLNEKVKQFENSESSGKIQKYETLLEKCKAEITKNKEKIKELTAENESLRQWNDNADGETGISDLATERVAAEWKQRIDKVEGEWTERLNAVESNYIDQVAAAKKETFIMMESKDKEIENLRSKCRELEIQDGQANERWQKKVDELQAIVKALETEKTDMVEKLSAAKAQGVQAVRDEETAKRSALLAEWKQKEEENERNVADMEKKHKEALENLENLASQLASLKSAKEEEEAAAVNVNKSSQQHLEIQLAELEEKLQASEAIIAEKNAEMETVMGNMLAKHKEEVAVLIREHEELLTLTKQQAEVERVNMTDMISFLEKDLDQLRTNAEKSRKDSDAHQQSIIEELHMRENNFKSEIEKLKGQLAELTDKHSQEITNLNYANQKGTKYLQSELEQLREDLEKSTSYINEMNEKSNAAKKESDDQLTEIKNILQERNDTVRRLEQDKTELEIELARSRELSVMHEHLRTELDEARKQKEVAETQLFELVKGTEGEKHVDEELIKVENVSISEAVPSAEVNELKERLTALEQKNQELETSLSTIAVEKEGLVQQLAVLSAEDKEVSKKYNDNIDSLKDERNKLEEEKSHISQRLDALQAETAQVIAELTQRADTADSLVADEVKKRQQVEEELTLAKEQLENVNQQLVQTDELRKEKDASENLIRKFEMEKNNLEEELQKKEALFEEVKKVAESTQKELEKIKNSTEDEQKLLKNEMELLNERKTTLESSLANLQEQLDLLRKENDELQSRVADTTQIESVIMAEKAKVDELEKQYKQNLDIMTQQLREREETIEKQKNEAEILKKQLGEIETAKRNIDSSKIRELEELNERMRVEFIAKEKILSELREQLDAARENSTEIEKKNSETVRRLEDELKRATVEVENAVGTIESLRQALSKVDDSRKENENKLKQAKDEDAKIREQYSIALENLKTELGDAHRKIATLEKIEAERDELSKKAASLAEELHVKEEEFQKNKEKLETEWKNKAQKAVQRQKKTSEDEAAAAKAELMLQIDTLHSDISMKEKRLDDVALEKARLEQEIVALNSVKADLDAKKEKEKQLSSKLSELEHRLIELEAENKVVTDRKNELEAVKENITAELEQLKTSFSEKENELKLLRDVNEDSMRKAAAKQDTDSKKVIRELQREVKQLYVELNEKTELLENLKKQLEEQKVTTTDSAAIAVKTTSTESTSQKNYMYEEELEAMRRKLKESHKEIDDLRDLNSRLERNLESSKKLQKVPSPPKTNGTTATNYESCGFADPAEAEYLRNVLYNYMANRENLGKDCVTLARVIGTVAKFDKTQLDTVLAKEESRLVGWVGETVSHMSHALSGVRQ